MIDILIVIDMQNDFIDGKLGTPEARAIVPRIENKVKAFLQNKNSKCIFSQDTHSYNYSLTIEGKTVPTHCIENTPGWCINNQLFQRLVFPNRLFVIKKPTFGYLDWKNFIKDRFNDAVINSITLVGVCTDICVISNALILRALYPEIPIIVDATCCAGTTPEKHEMALEVMKSCCIKVINK